MSDWTTTAALALGSVVILWIGQQALRNRTRCSLPPGPPGLPWVGNVIGIDTTAPWKTYAEWARTYGDIVYSRLFGRDIIIINSEKIAKDLLENRSKNYSDRPQMITLEMCGLGFNSAMLPYGDKWRLHRRLFHQTFRLDAVPRFWPLQHHKACHFLRKLLNTPEQLDDHVFEYSTSIALNSVYDYDPASLQDELVKIASRLVEIVAPAVRPDIDIIFGQFRLLFRLPSWLPGMSFKKKMEIANTYSKQYLERAFKHSRQRMGMGNNVTPSMVGDALRGMEEKGISPQESWMTALKEASGTAFLGGSETSHSVLMTFFLMMVLNPAVQEKAQVQIDDVVGNDRLPTSDDRPLLPLIDAILWETLRHNVAVPLSPRITTDEDVYGGFRIPKGAIIMMNLWSMAHDESRFPNPEAFIPERFLNDNGSLKPNEIEHIAFGFGRRICVGRYFADTSVWAIMAKVLAVFKILKPLDKNGIEIPVEARFSSGLIVAPIPFGFRIVPRCPGMDIGKLEQLIAACTP